MSLTKNAKFSLAYFLNPILVHRNILALPVILVLFSSTNTQSSSQEFGTFSTQNGDVISISRSSDGVLSGFFSQLAVDGSETSSVPITGVNVVPGVLELEDGNVLVTYRRRTERVQAENSLATFVEWYTDNDTSTLPASFRSLIVAESQRRSQETSVVPNATTLTLEQLTAIQRDTDAVVEELLGRLIIPPDDNGTAVQITAPRRTLSWLDSSLRNIGVPDLLSSGAFIDTVGRDTVVTTLSMDTVNSIRTSLDLSDATSQPNAPELLEINAEIEDKTWELVVPNPNIILDFHRNPRDANTTRRFTELLNSIGDTCFRVRSTAGAAMIRIACYYYAEDVGIREPIWFLTLSNIVFQDTPIGSQMVLAVFSQTYSTRAREQEYEEVRRETNSRNWSVASISQSGRVERHHRARIRNVATEQFRIGSLQ